jgi:hypothetical protein
MTKKIQKILLATISTAISVDGGSRYPGGKGVMKLVRQSLWGYLTRINTLMIRMEVLSGINSPYMV